MISGTIHRRIHDIKAVSSLTLKKNIIYGSLWLLMAPYGLHIHHVALQQPQIEKVGKLENACKTSSNYHPGNARHPFSGLLLGGSSHLVPDYIVNLMIVSPNL